MKDIDAKECELQVLVCTNDRTDRTCCKAVGGQEFFEKLKRKLKETGKNSTRWATRTGCLGYCNAVGTTVTIHRFGEAPKWYSEVTDKDFDFIWNEVTK